MVLLIGIWDYRTQSPHQALCLEQPTADISVLILAIDASRPSPKSAYAYTPSRPHVPTARAAGLESIGVDAGRQGGHEASI